MVEQTEKDRALNSHKNVVYIASEDISDAAQVKGYDFNKGLNYEEVFKTYVNTGFQATSLG